MSDQINQNLPVIKWLVSLDPKKQIVALLLITILFLATPLSIIFTETRRQLSNKQDQYEQAVIQCGIEKEKIRQQANEEVKTIMKERIVQLEKEKQRGYMIDTLVTKFEKELEQKKRKLSNGKN